MTVSLLTALIVGLQATKCAVPQRCASGRVGKRSGWPPILKDLGLQSLTASLPKLRSRAVPTESQLSANKRNAAKSTGPRSAAGRMKSSHNALRNELAVSIASLQEFQPTSIGLQPALNVMLQERFPGVGSDGRRSSARSMRIHDVRTRLWRTRFGNAGPIYFIDEWEDQFNALEKYESDELGRAARKRCCQTNPHLRWRRHKLSKELYPRPRT